MLSRSPAALAAIARTAQPSLLLPVQAMAFTGKTESGFKYKTPKLRMRKVQRVEAPGLKLKIPADLDAETFCKQIGGDCDDTNAAVNPGATEVCALALQHLANRACAASDAKRRCQPCTMVWSSAVSRATRDVVPQKGRYVLARRVDGSQLPKANLLDATLTRVDGRCLQLPFKTVRQGRCAAAALLVVVLLQPPRARSYDVTFMRVDGASLRLPCKDVARQSVGAALAPAVVHLGDA